MTDSTDGQANHHDGSDGQLAWMRHYVAGADGDIATIDASQVTSRREEDWQGETLSGAEQKMIGTLASAIAAAASAAGQLIQEQSLDTPLDERKIALDGTATAAAEKILSQGGFRITVSAGEGERDGSPGAQSGQVIGEQNAIEGGVHGIFDYVDGTTLAAKGQAGALALGAFGRGVRTVPDLQAFAVIGPKTAVAELDLVTPYEKGASSWVEALAEHLGQSPDELTILTHSLGSRPNHLTLIEGLRELVREVIVPPGVTIEPPYLLSLVDLSRPRIDALIGSIGLSELSYAAALLDLIAPDFGIRFRLASVQGPRNSPESTVLDGLSDFSSEELSTLETYAFSAHKTYSEKDLLVQGGALAAALFAITPNTVLGWPGANETSGQQVTGIVALPDKEVVRLHIGYRS